jgi:hypothetical protein
VIAVKGFSGLLGYQLPQVFFLALGDPSETNFADCAPKVSR